MNRLKNIFQVSYGQKNKFSMASTFYFVNHDFRASTFLKMVETVYAAMPLGGGWDEAMKLIKKKVFFNHSANAVSEIGPLYCI